MALQLTVSLIYFVVSIVLTEFFGIAFCWCATCSATCFCVYYFIIAYLSYEVVTLVQTVYEQSSEFPTVTFCPIIKSYFDNYDLWENGHFGYDLSIGIELENDFVLSIH